MSYKKQHGLPGEADLLVRQDIRGGLLANIKAHRIASYRTPPPGAVNSPAAPLTNNSTGSGDSTDSRTPMMNPKVGPLIYSDYSHDHAFRGSPESETIDEILRRRERKKKKATDYCIAVLLIFTFLCVAGVVTAIAYFSIFQSETEDILSINASKIEGKNKTSTNDNPYNVHLNGSLLIVDSDLMLNNEEDPIYSNIAFLVEKGITRALTESHLASRFINTVYHSVSYGLPGVRTFFTLSINPEPITNENGEHINVLADLPMVIKGGIQKGHFYPLKLDVDYVSLYDSSGQHPNSTISSSTSTTPTTTTTGTTTTTVSTTPIVQQTSSSSAILQNNTTPSNVVVTEILPDTSQTCGDIGSVLNENSPAAECARLTQPILYAFPSLTGQCHHLEEMVECISVKMNCTVSQTKQSVFNARKWFVSNFRSFDPSMCPK